MVNARDEIDAESRTEPDPFEDRCFDPCNRGFSAPTPMGFDQFNDVVPAVLCDG